MRFNLIISYRGYRFLLHGIEAEESLMLDETYCPEPHFARAANNERLIDDFYQQVKVESVERLNH